MKEQLENHADEQAPGDAKASATTFGESAEPDRALKVHVIRNTAPNAPVITSMSLARGASFDVVLFDLAKDRFELSVDDAHQAVEPQRVEIGDGQDASGKKRYHVEYIPGFIVAPDSPIKLK